MSEKMAFRDAFEAVPPEIREEVRSSLLALSNKLFELYKGESNVTFERACELTGWKGTREDFEHVYGPVENVTFQRTDLAQPIFLSLGIWARKFWLQAYLNLGPNGVFELLKSIDCAERDLFGVEQMVVPIADVRRALFAFIDHVREHVS